MKRTVIHVLAAVAMAVLLTSGAVLARSIDCTGGPCIGTRQGDTFVGTSGTDQIAGRGGKDVILGDPRSAAAGDDTLLGGSRGDKITDKGDGGTNKGIDHIFGGKGGDVIDVREGDDSIDAVDCGPGADTVFADPSDDLTDCEIVNPN
jgi:hypothetical protein